MAFTFPKATTPQEVAARLNAGEKLFLLDVRESEEWAAGHIAGAVHIPVGQLFGRLQELDPSKETIVICRSGNRSGLACEMLSEKGFNVVNMTGGLNAWTDKLV
ncbi:rhodanese-like domain-containing protein [Paenibacillus aurantius]|uniref:Rhodanese-like domain-containing protein n=1 Tax=Paenibacillus aurantius TaxID=2918900 RepID=A0AA96RK69_9BACL|nr:rhodanese-like domain-containing protein [Paenibacillus aurantius]WNQ14054.1 rhodanese-like domain-containing protein [Paenibacillus aurantius]